MRRKRWLSSLCVLAGLVIIGYSGWRYWFTHRSQPAPVSRRLFDGVTYARDVRRFPRPLVIHVITVDLNRVGIRFLVTPPDHPGNLPLRAQTTAAFLRKYGLQVAVNGDYFYPFRSQSLLNYYPHGGDPVTVEGIAASRGLIYSSTPGKLKFPTLYLSVHNQASFLRPIGPVYNAVSGSAMILRDGKNCYGGLSGWRKPEPCTSVALDKSGRRLMILVVDGRQPRYSEGVSGAEFGEMIRQYGGWNAMDLDGGGSESLVMQGSDGEPVLLNEPIDSGVLGRERVVANHLGIYALRMGSQTGKHP